MGQKRRLGGTARHYSKAESGIRLKDSTARHSGEHDEVQLCKDSAVPDTSQTTPTAGKLPRPRKPFKILIVGCKRKTTTARHKTLTAHCRSVPAPKQSKKQVGHRKGHGTRKTRKSWRTGGRWRAAGASKKSQVITKRRSDLRNSSALPGSSSHQGSESAAVNTFTLPKPVMVTTKTDLPSVEGESRTRSALSASGSVEACRGPRTRSQSGGTFSTYESMAEFSCTRSSSHCPNNQASRKTVVEKDKETHTYIRRSSLRKRSREQAGFTSANKAFPSMLSVELSQALLSGRTKRPRITQREAEPRGLTGSAVAHTAAAVTVETPFKDRQKGLGVEKPETKTPQRRRNFGRSRKAKGLGTQTTPGLKTHTAAADVVRACPRSPTIQLRQPGWPNDPTRPFCHRAVSFEPADLGLGFDGVMEWPCVAVDAAAESPDSASQTDEQPRYFLCGGLPDPPRSPPWRTRATSGGDRREASHNDNLHESKEEPCANEAEQEEEATDGRLAAQPLPGPVLQSGMQHKSESGEDPSGEKAYRQCLPSPSVTTAPQHANDNEKTPVEEDEAEKWTFLPPDSDRAQAIVNFMGESIRRIIATTRAAQRRTEMYSKLCERLFDVDIQGRLLWVEKTTANGFKSTSPICTQVIRNHTTVIDTELEKSMGLASARDYECNSSDESRCFQGTRSVHAILPKPTGSMQSQVAPVRAAPVASSSGFLAYLENLEARLLRSPSFENDEFAKMCLLLLKKYGRR